MKKYRSISAQQTKDSAGEIAKDLHGGDVVCLYGDLGAGKTTFTQGLLTTLDIEGPYPSPTFTIVNVYDVPVDGERNFMKDVRIVYHMDAYRIEDKDVDSIGWAEMIADENGIIILEWPERISSVIPSDAKSIRFTAVDEQTRELVCENF